MAAEHQVMIWYFDSFELALLGIEIVAHGQAVLPVL